MAQYYCTTLTVGNRKGWRLPTIQDLSSLIDPMVAPGPTLPSGHPFSNVQSLPPYYWSATTSAFGSTFAWVVSFNNGLVDNGLTKDSGLFVWCVRGGQGVDPQ
jgi:hypothetical protein